MDGLSEERQLRPNRSGRSGSFKPSNRRGETRADAGLEEISHEKQIQRDKPDAREAAGELSTPI